MMSRAYRVVLATLVTMVVTSSIAVLWYTQGPAWLEWVLVFPGMLLVRVLPSSMVDGGFEVTFMWGAVLAIPFWWAATFGLSSVIARLRARAQRAGVA
jgi:hypothetical protein